jgi:protein-arginine kinase activator protein McsA
MGRVARCFGDPEDMDFDHLPDSADVQITEESLKGKLENKQEMERVAEILIKQENYEGARKVWDHIEVVGQVIQAENDKKKAAQDEQYELAMRLRDDINALKEKLLDENQILGKEITYF